MEWIIVGFSSILWGITAIIDLIFLAIHNSRRLYEHELGHANAAKSFKCPVFILMKNGKMNGIQNEIPCYKVTKEDFESMYNSESAAAVTIYDNYENLSHDQMKEITMAGPKSEKRWLLNWKRQLPVLCILFLLSMALIVTFTHYIYFWDKIILTLNVPLLTHIVFMWCKLARSKGMFPKKKIYKFKKSLEDKVEGDTLEGGVCDSAKLKYRDTYIECLEIIKNKKLKPKKGYNEILEELESKGYSIYSSEMTQKSKTVEQK